MALGEGAQQQAYYRGAACSWVQQLARNAPLM